ncbi:GNAT family N-acetyltransferase [Fulvivirga sp. RKSG066]|uniref:arsenic resistance N-acetyltransferase ArsN2 n=1 Tax=Fulvivirga aurantia TaxID=2529383 RepID=UPI0012BB6A95|nr:arsenic resistance N-acetyltransferase ArsN2 [Fulvivirga aurantia]MTI21617.1 GNAT family N-acetyltransferase [Fulvivirga aurantia]
MRLLGKTDKESVNQLLRSCNLMTDSIDFDHHQILGEFENDDLIAMAVLEIYESDALLRSVAVKSSLKNKGRGTELVKEVEDHARSLNVDHVYLLTETAKGFFQKLNYTEINRSLAPISVRQTEQFSKLCPESAICMYKQLVK